MLSATNVEKFRQSVEILEAVGKNPRIRSGNVAVATAVLLHGSHRQQASSIESRIFAPGEGQPVSTGYLQTDICDHTWQKRAEFLPSNAEGPIFKPLTRSFKPHSSSANNNWRNSFDLQAGLGCDAPYNSDFLRDPEFIATPRFNCPYRNLVDANCSSPAGLTGANRTCFNPSKHSDPPSPDTQAAMTPKLLTRVRTNTSSGYHLVPPTLGSVTGLLTDPTVRIPAWAFAMALYGGSSTLMAVSEAVTVDRLQADLGLSDALFLALFEPDPTAPGNSVLLASGASGGQVTLSSSEIEAATPATMSGPGNVVPFDASVSVPVFQAKIGNTKDPAERLRLQEKASIAHNRALRALGLDLQARGYSSLTEQISGYDLSAKKNGRDYLFEVKTWTDLNIRTQIRHAVIQLYEYRFFNGMSPDTEMVLVLDRRPPNWLPPTMWQFILDDRGVIPAWMEGGEITTFAHLSSELP